MNSLKKVLAVIPARYKSQRFPGKPLASILGKPMIEWVYRSVEKALPHVVVATDDKRIWQAVKNFGGESIMTSSKCKSGTDRMYQVSRKMNYPTYVNVQGDEPLINPKTIRDTVRLSWSHNDIATAATDLHLKDLKDPHVVKVIVNSQKEALYFMRTNPFAHPLPKSGTPLVYKHLGLYVYPKNHLQTFVRNPQSLLEKTEKLEQLRALYYGQKIFVSMTPYDSLGIDTPSDLKKVEKILKDRAK